MGTLLGLMAALCWGSADFLARYATRRIGTYRTLLFMQIFGFVGLGLWLWQTGEFDHLYNHTVWQDWVWTFIAAILNIISSLSLYRAFEVGVLSIVSPIGASYGAFTVLLSILSGETLSFTRALGVIFALLGVIFASISPSDTKFATDTVIKSSDKANNSGTVSKMIASISSLPRGVGPAILAAFCFGLTFWTLGFQVIPHLGGVAPIWFIRLTTICVLVCLAAPVRQSIKFPPGKVWWYIAGVGVLDTTAFVSNTVGITTDQVSIVTILASLFSAVTVLLAWVFLHESLRRLQWLGILIIFASIVLVSV